jgi:hypothetical protein
MPSSGTSAASTTSGMRGPFSSLILAGLPDRMTPLGCILV